jgi:hypothetical protein
VLSPRWAPECQGNNNLKSEKVVKSYVDIVKKNTFVEVGTRGVDVEHASLVNESSGGFDELDCQYTPTEREDQRSTLYQIGWFKCSNITLISKQKCLALIGFYKGASFFSWSAVPF